MTHEGLNCFFFFSSEKKRHPLLHSTKRFNINQKLYFSLYYFAASSLITHQQAVDKIIRSAAAQVRALRRMERATPRKEADNGGKKINREGLCTWKKARA